MSETSSISVDTSLRNVDTLNGGIKNLSLVSDSIDLNSESERRNKDLYDEHDISGSASKSYSRNNDYMNKYYSNVPRRINSVVSEDEGDVTTENTTSETDTVLSSGDIFQMIGSENNWGKEVHRVPSMAGRASSIHDKLKFQDEHKNLAVRRLQLGAVNNFDLPNAGESHSLANETDVLKKQLVQYRIKVKALTEILKQINLDSDSNSQINEKIRSVKESKNAVTYNAESYAASLDDETRNSPIAIEEHEKLVITLEEKNKELIKLKEELIRNKDEYETMLEEVNDYLQHNETISNEVSSILNFLLDNMDLTAEEQDNLVRATNFEPTFIDVKIKALSVNVVKLVNELASRKDYEQISNLDSAKATDVVPESDVSHNDTSEILDSKLELAIETMHEKYHDFLQSIQYKLQRNEFLEKALKDKLQDQKVLLESIANTENERIRIQNPKQYLQKSQSDFFSSIDELGKRASMDLSKSYQDHVEALNNMLQNYKNELEDKDKQLTELRSQRRNSFNTNTELDLAEKIKEQSLTLEETSSRWHKQRSGYESKIEALQNEKHDLTMKLNAVRTQLQSLEAKTEGEFMEMRKKLNTAMRKAAYYVEDNQLLQEQMEELGNDRNILQEENSKLRERAGEFQDGDKTLQQFTLLKSKLLDHLKAIFGSFDKILQKESIDQAFNKLHNLEQLDGAKHFKKTLVKLDSVFFFIESAIDSIITEHIDILLKQKDEWSSSPLEDKLQKQSSLKIDELRKKWIGERERRKLESEAATSRINMLQIENQRLREQLGVR